MSSANFLSIPSRYFPLKIFTTGRSAPEWRRSNSSRSNCYKSSADRTMSSQKHFNTQKRSLEFYLCKETNIEFFNRKFPLSLYTWSKHSNRLLWIKYGLEGGDWWNNGLYCNNQAFQFGFWILSFCKIDKVAKKKACALVSFTLGLILWGEKYL